jgi:poly(A) polymerase
MSQVVIPRSGHPVSRKDIDPCALKVLYRLYRAGHHAYLVGGGVRDLLLGVQPKDFDVATDAHPARIKKLFRNCVLVGRRFRLAHVRFGPTIIETSTFRRTPEAHELADADEAELLIKRDNTFGTPEDDAMRRDFTINALFYDIGTYSLIDYVGGMKDIEDGWIRCIGDPDVRFQEDPVRMLRAVKFAARLGFDITEEDLASISRHRDHLDNAAVPRLLEEMYKFLRGGASAASFKMMQDLGLLEHFVPEAAEYLECTVDQDNPEDGALYQSLFGLDAVLKRLRGPDPTNSLLLGALLAPQVATHLAANDASGDTIWTASDDEIEEAFEEVAAPLIRRFMVARRDTDRLRRMIWAQRRLAKGRDSRSESMERQHWFHEAVLLLRVGARSHEELRDATKIWARRAREVEPTPEPRRPGAGRPRRGRRDGGRGRRDR